jgi:hypothetical protein
VKKIQILKLFQQAVRDSADVQSDNTMKRFTELILTVILLTQTLSRKTPNSSCYRLGFEFRKIKYHSGIFQLLPAVQYSCVKFSSLLYSTHCCLYCDVTRIGDYLIPNSAETKPKVLHRLLSNDMQGAICVQTVAY